MRKILLFLFILISFRSIGQELDCQVQVLAPNLQLADPTVFKQLESSIFEFMNNRKWTPDAFEGNEKIECKLILTITQEISIDEFVATATIQSNRPVYNSDYQSVIFNYADKNFEFKYTQFQPLDYTDNAFLNNLTSMLAYYAYIIIGLDYDSFSKGGGTPYFLKAQNIVTSAQNVSQAGWKSFDGSRNRYWLIENLLNGQFAKYRDSFYEYHINGLDRMYENRREATVAITNVLDQLDDVNDNRPNSMLIQLFFQAKSDEMVNIFKKADRQDQARAALILNKLDPINSEKYKIFN